MAARPRDEMMDTLFIDLHGTNDRKCKGILVIYLIQSDDLLFLRLIRLPNLILTLVTQALFYICLLWHPARKVDHLLLFGPFDFALLAFCTLTIMAGGYIINDIFDYPSDFINRKERVIIRKLVSESTAMTYYNILNVLAIIAALWLAWRLKDAGLGALILGTIYLLYLYSKFLQNTPLLGNVIVAFLCALIIWIVMVGGQRDLLILDIGDFYRIIILFWAFGTFAFLATLWRELVKDMEDRKGDEAIGARTLAILGSRQTTTILMICISLILIALLAFFTYWGRANLRAIGIFYGIGLIASTVVLGILTVRADSNVQFRRMSFFLKIYFLQGLIFILFWHV